MNLRFTILSLLLTALSVSAQTTAKPGAKAPAKAVEPAPQTATSPEPAAPVADPAAETAQPEKIISQFFAALQRREVEEGYDQLTKGTKIAERAEDVKTLKSKTKDAIAVFGPIKGHENIARKNVGERLVSYTYVSLGQDFPLRWRFYFYKPETAWKLIDLRVDDRLAAIFDEIEVPRARDDKREP